VSFYDDASLVLIPSGTKTSKIYSQKPTDGTGDLTFTRSNDTASRVASNGLIERVRTNNLLYSQDASNGVWGKLGSIIVTSNTATAPDGTNTAFTLDDQTTSFGSIRQTLSTSATTYTFSFFIKKTTGALTNYAGAEIGSLGNYLIIDTTNGTGNATAPSFDFSIVSYDANWWRVSLIAYLGGGSRTFGFWPAISSNGTSIDGTAVGSNIFWGAQVETGDIATDYIATTSAAVSVGPVANVPRIDYTGGGCGRLNLEPQRTNLFNFSQYFGGWAANPLGISSIEPNYAISPEGVENAYKVNFVVQGDSDLALVEGHSVTGGSTYAYSIYIKGEGSDIGKDIVVKSKRSGGDSAGTITTQTLTGEWVRVDFTTTYAANNAAANFYISSNDATSCLIYGAQAELGSYPTSLIPTYGAAVTRGADACSKTGISSLIGQTEGTIFWEGSIDNFANFATLLVLEGTSNSWIYCLSYIDGLTFEVRSNNVLTASYLTTFTTGSHKIAVAYNASQVAIYIDGVSVFTDNSVTIPATSNLYLGGWSNYNQAVKTAQALLFKTRLSNADLAALTA
jgi:hypothetical protein